MKRGVVEYSDNNKHTPVDLGGWTGRELMKGIQKLKLGEISDPHAGSSLAVMEVFLAAYAGGRWVGGFDTVAS